MTQKLQVVIGFIPKPRQIVVIGLAPINANKADNRKGYPYVGQGRIAIRILYDWG